MLTVKRGDSIFNFVLSDSVRSANQSPKAPAGHTQRQIWFGAIIFAESFLRGFASNSSASSGMSSLLSELEGKKRVNVSPNDWIPELAPYLVSGKLLVTEAQKRKPGGEGTKSEKKKKEEVARPVPRRGPTQERAEAPEQSTFSNVSEDTQANALIVAAQSGAAFCEVCSKA